MIVSNFLTIKGAQNMFGYAGKIIRVDLAQKKTNIVHIPESFCRDYIGGNGFSIDLLYNNSKPGIDPLSPDNVLVFAIGPFAATLVPTNGKFIVQAKSPLTNFMGESVCSGSWGPSLKHAGFDAILITGKYEKPVYLFVDDDKIRFNDATKLWGLDAWETEERIREEVGDQTTSVAAIGPAGERLVRFACITSDRGRQAGRTGMGAVMGSKNLKAVAVRGTNDVSVADPDDLLERCLDLAKECKGEATWGYRKYGTIRLIAPKNAMGAFPTRNWQQSTFEFADKLSGEYINENYVTKVIACAGCAIGCDHISTITEGPYKGVVSSVDHETVYALGFECGIGYFPAITKATELCDRLGIDTMSAGVTIGWAMECYEKGILTKRETDGIELTFGNHEEMIEILEKIAARDGIGNLLAEGVKRASKTVGHGSEHFAMHSKGLELPAYDIRSLKACALGFMTSTRGGCHLRSRPYDLDLGGLIDRNKEDPAIGKVIADMENLAAVVDSLIICKFARDVFINYDELSHLYSLVTGISMTPLELRSAGERIYNLEKAYNIRERWTRKDEYPPPRAFEDPVPDGIAKGSLLTREGYDLMLDAYFKARGWNIQGIPAKQKLCDLGLDKIAQDINSPDN